MMQSSSSAVPDQVERERGNLGRTIPLAGREHERTCD